MSSRRSGGASRGSSSRRQALEEIRRLRERGVEAGSGGEESDGESAAASARRASRLAHYQPEESSVFKTVTDKEYEELVQQRREGLPFVENDAGEMGYYDDGEEHFFESDTETGGANGGNESDGGAVDGSKKRSAGALSSSYVRRAKKMQRAKLGNGSDQKITKMFFSAGNKTAAGNGPGPRPVSRSTAKRGMCNSLIDVS